MLKTRAGAIFGNVPKTKLRRFLRIREVCATTGLPVSTVYEKMQEGSFPKNVRLTPRVVAWVEDEILEWQQARIAERDRGADASA